MTHSVSTQTVSQFKTVIKPVEGWNLIRFDELWSYRELLYFFTIKELKVRYKQTILGIGWAILQPLFSMIIFTLFFGRLANMPSDGVPYSVFALTGLMPWFFFSNGVTNAASGIVANANLIKKVYFPKILLPTSNILAAIVDLLFTFLLLLIMLPLNQIYPSARYFLVPILFAFALMTSLGVSYWLSALNGLFRDIKYVIPFLMQLWMFMSPIVYPVSIVPEKWQLIYSINPMVGVVESFRWMLLGDHMITSMTHTTILVSLSVSVFVFVSGLWYFSKIESSLADVV